MNKSSSDGLTNGAMQTRSRNYSVTWRKKRQKLWKRCVLLNSATISTRGVSCSDQCATWSFSHKFVEIRCTKGVWRKESHSRWSLRLKRCRLNRSSLRLSSKSSKKSTGSNLERKRFSRTSAIRPTFVELLPFQTKLWRCLTRHLMTFTKACANLAMMAATYWINSSNSKVAPQCSKIWQLLRLWPKPILAVEQ